MADSALDLNALLSGTDAALYAGVSVNVIVNWRNRGLLPIATDEAGNEIRDSRGRPRYRLLAVAETQAPPVIASPPVPATQAAEPPLAAGDPPIVVPPAGEPASGAFIPQVSA